jgi:hypothetical protein
MAATYPDLLASGVTDLGRFDPFDLMAGEGPIVDDQGQAADGVAWLQFQVLMRNADGRLVPLTTAGDYAVGSYVVGGQPAAADVITINGVVLTFRVAPTLADEIEIGATATITAANIAARINEEVERFGVSATSAGTTVSLVAEDIGTAGNAITITETVTDAGFTVSGATLTGANAAEDVPSGDAVAVAMQPVAAATPGAWGPVRVGGIFNHEALVWPVGLATLEQRKRAFDGTMLGCRQLL